MKKDTLLYLDNRLLLYEGSKKIVYGDQQENSNILHFKDTVTNEVTGDVVSIPGKGVINNTVSAAFFGKLSEWGIPHHFIAKQSAREQQVHALEIFSFYVLIRNYATGFLVEDLGIDRGVPLNQPVMEFYTKMTDKPSTLLSRDHLDAFGFASRAEIEDIFQIGLRLNDLLRGFFSSLALQLYTLKLSFGRRYNYLMDDMDVTVGDEISLDTCHVVDGTTGRALGRFGLDDNSSIDLYQELLHRCPFLQHSSSEEEGGGIVVPFQP